MLTYELPPKLFLPDLDTLRAVCEQSGVVFIHVPRGLQGTHTVTSEWTKPDGTKEEVTVAVTIVRTTPDAP